jgi:hypothetical protein
MRSFPFQAVCGRRIGLGEMPTVPAKSNETSYPHFLQQKLLPKIEIGQNCIALCIAWQAPPA